MSEADTIIGIYQGFQSAIGCGRTILWQEDTTWYLQWTSPFSSRTKTHVARYAFARRELVNRHWTKDFSVDTWGAILASEVREKWGGNPDQADKDSKPLIFQDGLGE